MARAGTGERRLSSHVLLTILGPAVAYPIAGIDPLMLNLNLSAVSEGLAVPAGSLGLLAGASTLVVAATVLAVGNLGDRFGLKRILVFGLIGNIVVAIGSALAPNYPALLAMRFLDGLTLAALLGVSLALVSASVPKDLRSTAIGIVMAVYTLMYGIAPLLGGYVVGAFGWRSLFLVTTPFAIVALALTTRFVREPPRHPAARFDAPGVALFGLALLGLVAGIGAAPNGFGQPRVWIPLAASALAILLLLVHERSTPQPALNLRLFSHRAFLVAVLATVATNVFSSGLGTVIGQLGSYVLGMSAQSIGLIYLPGTLLVALASVLAGRAVAKRTARPVLILGLLIVGMSGVVMAVTASPIMGVAVLVLATWLSNLGGFITGTAAADTILGDAPEGNTGSVAAIQPAFAMTGYALGPTLVILLLDVFFQHEWMADAASKGLPTQQAQDAVTAVTGAVTSSPGMVGYSPNLFALADGLSLGIDYTNGVRLAMLILALAPIGVAVAAAFLIPRRAAITVCSTPTE
ncbi:MAG: MFS transporter [Actinomycetes bacterium]